MLRAGVVCLIVLATQAEVARAAEPSDEARRRAREHHARGEKAFQQRRYEEALAAFQAGFDLVPRAGFLLNMALTEQRRGNLPRAAALYRQYLIAEPQSPDRATIEATLAEIERATEPRPTASTEPPVAPDQDTSSRALLAVPSQPSPAPSSSLRRPPWWVMTGVGAVVLSVIVVGLTSGSNAPSSGSLGNTRTR